MGNHGRRAPNLRYHRTVCLVGAAELCMMRHTGPGPGARGSGKRLTTADDLLVFNGVDATSGDYLLPPMPAATVSLAARGEVVDPEHLRELRERHWAASESFLGVKEGVDPTDLAQSGWGVVFATDGDPAVREALAELLDHRRAQAGPRFREFSGADAYRPGESKQDFLARHGAGPGAVDPTRVPYYLMLVGSPVAIPYRVQYQLDVQHAVGRLDLGAPEAYASYRAECRGRRVEDAGATRVRGVVRAGEPRRPRDRAHLVHPHHPTGRSADLAGTRGQSRVNVSPRDQGLSRASRQRQRRSCRALQREPWPRLPIRSSRTACAAGRARLSRMGGSVFEMPSRHASSRSRPTMSPTTPSSVDSSTSCSPASAGAHRSSTTSPRERQGPGSNSHPSPSAPRCRNDFSVTRAAVHSP